MFGSVLCGCHSASSWMHEQKPFPPERQKCSGDSTVLRHQHSSVQICFLNPPLATWGTVSKGQ